MDNQFDVGLYFRNLRVQQGETLHQVAKGTDIDMTMLSKIERGERLPTTEQAKQLAQYFKVKESEVLAKVTAGKIIKDYGINETTFNAVKLVEEQITPYIIQSKK